MIRRLRMLALGCSVCRQRRRCLSYCPRRPGFYRPAPFPPILLALLLVAPFWIGTYLVAGWVGIGVMLIVCGVTELLLFAAPPWWDRVQHIRQERAVRTSRPPEVFREEIVGELYAVRDVPSRLHVLPRPRGPRPKAAPQPPKARTLRS